MRNRDVFGFLGLVLLFGNFSLAEARAECTDLDRREGLLQKEKSRVSAVLKANQDFLERENNRSPDSVSRGLNVRTNVLILRVRAERIETDFEIIKRERSARNCQISAGD